MVPSNKNAGDGQVNYDYTIIYVRKGQDTVNSAFGGYMSYLHKSIHGMAIGLAMSELGKCGWQVWKVLEDDKFQQFIMEKIIEPKPTLFVKFVTSGGFVVEAFGIPEHLIPKPKEMEETELRNALIFWGFTQDSMEKEGTMRTFFYHTTAPEHPPK